MSDSRKKIAIVGGGFAGLTLAFLLSQKKRNVVVFEKSRLGGMIETQKHEYGLFETAANGIILNDRVEHFLKQLELEPISMGSSSGKRWFFHGSFSRWPLGFFETIKVIFNFLRNYFAKSLAPKPFETVKEWGERNFSKVFAGKVLGTGLQGIYASDPKNLSANLILGRFFKKKRQKYKGTICFEKGMQQFVDQLVDACKKNQVQFVFEEAQVDSLAKNFSRIVIATSVADAAQILQTSSMYEFKEIGKKLASVQVLPIMTVQAAFKNFKSRYQGFGVLIGAGPSLKALGVLFSSFIFPAQQNKNFLENWIFGGTRSPETLNLTESEISELVAKERASLIQVHEAPQTLRFRKWERGLPHYTTDLERLLSEMQLPKGLYLHGNYLQGIGLSQILERSYKLSEEL